ncbi:MAG: transporter [Candidatus Hydrogenedentota bacterium]
MEYHKVKKEILTILLDSLSIFSTFTCTTTTLLLLIAPQKGIAIAPLKTEEAYTIPYSYTCEMISRFESTKIGGNRIETLSATIVPTFSLRDNMNLIFYLPLEHSKIKHTSSSNSGLGDIDVNFKYLIAKESIDRPAVSLNLDIKFGIASKDESPARGTENEDFSLYLALSKKIKEKIEVDFNAGYTKVGADYLDNVIFYSGSLTNPINEYNFYMIELCGNTNTMPDKNDEPISAFFGFKHITYRNVELSIGTSVGLTNTAPDYEIVLGAYYEFY